MDYSIKRGSPNQIAIQDEVTLELYPEFMHHDPVSNKYWETLFEIFSEYQFMLVSDDEIIGIANSLPYHWDGPLEELPDTGWDWVLEKGIQDYQNGVQPNTLNGLQIAIPKKYQGKGISAQILREMFGIARDQGFPRITVPVRPTLKSQYPLTPMDNYITWKREDKLPYDPWLRVHVRAGGTILKPCHKAMYIPGTIAEWEKWTGMKFFESGEYVVAGALRPVQIDIDNDLGEYTEPNVWIVHDISKM